MRPYMPRFIRQSLRLLIWRKKAVNLFGSNLQFSRMLKRVACPQTQWLV
jgi:hypothetical protein